MFAQITYIIVSHYHSKGLPWTLLTFDDCVYKHRFALISPTVSWNFIKSSLMRHKYTMYKTCRMDNLEGREVPHPSPCHWDKATPCGHIWVISASFTSVLYSLWFSYLCNKRVVTLASLNQNWAGLQEFIFWLFFWNSNPKKLFKWVASQTFLWKSI